LSSDGQERKKLFCNWCRVDTNHLLRGRYSMLRNDYPEEKDGGVHEHRYSLCSCAGCEEATLEWEVAYPEREESEDKWQEIDNTFFPPRSRDLGVLAQHTPKQFQQLNSNLGKLYSEVVGSLNRNCLLVVSIGLRALIEGVCKDKGLTEGNLERKIDGLIKFLPSVNVIQALHSFRFAGNSAAHDLEPMSLEDAGKAIDVIEDLLNFLYDLDYKASQIRIASNKGVPKSGLVH
jgi:hypothetical protein